MRLAMNWHIYRRQYMAVLLSLCLLLCALVFSGVALWYAKAPRSPSGDEPHYLIISQTLVKYRSLNVMQDYTNGDYRIFYPLPISPHVIPGASGRLLPIHSIGGPLLWLIAFALAGWLGAVLFMSAVTLLIVWNIYLLLCELEIEPRIALLVSMAYALASPLTLYAHLVFIEPIAALLCVYSSRKVVQKEVAWYDTLLCSLCLGILPWIHIRFALLEIVLFFAYLYKLYRLHKLRHVPTLLAYLLPVAGLFVIFELYNLHYWGTLNPAVNQITMDNRPFTGSLGTGVVGMLFDQEYGLIVNFPIFFLLLAGIILACRKRYAFYNILVLLLTVPYVIETASLQDWTGGWCPPARFILVLLPLYAFYIAYVLQQRRNWLAMILFFIGTAYGIVYNRLALQHSFNRKIGVNLTLTPITTGKYALVDYLPSLYRAHMTGVLIAWIAVYVLITLLLCVLPMRYTKGFSQHNTINLNKFGP